MFRQSRFESSHFLLTLAPFSEPKKKKKKECDLSLIALNSSLSAKKTPLIPGLAFHILIASK